MGSYKLCICFTRKFRMKEVGIPKKVKDVFSSYSEEGHMNAEHLLRFLTEFQGEEQVSIKDAEDIIEQIRSRRHHISGKFTKPLLTLEDFFYYLFCDDLNAPLSSQVHHDMTAPLSHYFIFTGHNSYLTGNQLSSDCSDVPIINALKRGVRVIELDMWPNSTKDDVDILHGRTLTTPVELIKCLKSIKEHAFSASTYPVVITLEDHLTPDLQAKVAKLVTQTFGDMLFCPESECLEEFPSPESLKLRIIISTKPPKEYKEENMFEDKENDLHKRKDSAEESMRKEVTHPKAEADTDDKNGSDQSENEEDLNDSDRKQLSSAAPEYRRLIAIHAGKQKGGMKEWLKVDPNKVRRLSLSEQKLEKAVESYGPDVVRFTQKNLLRIYPKGTRFNSSNYNPLIGWMHGAQMVAFNMQLAQFRGKIGRFGDLMTQTTVGIMNPGFFLNPRFQYPEGFVYSDNIRSGVTKVIERLAPDVTFAIEATREIHGGHLDPDGYGKSLWLMHGFFRANGGCGYLKKPDFLLDQNHIFDPHASLPVKKTLKVRVFMGDGWRLDFKQSHFDTYSPPDFYARVGIAGVTADNSMKKTKPIEDEWTPVWDEEFTFPLTVPELALLRIEVQEHDLSEKDDFGGQTVLPVSELRSGIRAVPLFDKKGDKFKSVKLLMQFEII